MLNTNEKDQQPIIKTANPSTKFYKTRYIQWAITTKRLASYWSVLIEIMKKNTRIDLTSIKVISTNKAGFEGKTGTQKTKVRIRQTTALLQIENDRTILVTNKPEGQEGDNSRDCTTATESPEHLH